MPRYRDGGDSFRSWLFTIAHNVLVDAERTRRPGHALQVAAAIVDHAPGPEEAALAAEARRDVRALLDAVAPDQRRMPALAWYLASPVGERGMTGTVAFQNRP